MLYIMLSVFAIIICAFVILIFGLLKAGRRADENEEKTLDIIAPSDQALYNTEKEKSEQIHESKVLEFK